MKAKGKKEQRLYVVTLFGRCLTRLADVGPRPRACCVAEFFLVSTQSKCVGGVREASGTISPPSWPVAGPWYARSLVSCSVPRDALL